MPDTLVDKKISKLIQYNIKAGPFFFNANETGMSLSALHWSTAAISCKKSNLQRPMTSASLRYLRKRLEGVTSSAAYRDVHYGIQSIGAVAGF